MYKVKKFTSICQAIKCAHKRKLVTFFCLTVYKLIDIMFFSLLFYAMYVHFLHVSFFIHRYFITFSKL